MKQLYFGREKSNRISPSYVSVGGCCQKVIAWCCQRNEVISTYANKKTRSSFFHLRKKNLIEEKSKEMEKKEVDQEELKKLQTKPLIKVRNNRN